MILAVALFATSTFGFNYGSIDPTRMPAEDWKNTQWSDPGGWTTIDVTTMGLPANNPSIDAAAQIASIISSTSGRRKLYFPAGTYYFNSTLTITSSDIWIDGDSSTTTIFRIVAPAATNAEIRFVGSQAASTIAVTSAPAPGATTLTVADASSLAVDDIIQLFADNAPLTNTGAASTWGHEVYSQNLRITAKSGNTLTLDMKVLLDYPSGYSPVVRKFNVLRNVKVQDIKIDRVNEPSSQDVSNLEFFWVYNGHVLNIESNRSGRNHVAAEFSKDVVVVGNYLHDAWQYAGGNGYAYGIALSASTGCRVSDNKVSGLRHQIILSLGANHNVISYNSCEGATDYNDMALHAVHAYMNLFEGNMFSESYADNSKDGWADVEARTGPGNTWFRNWGNGTVGSLQTTTTKQNVIANYLGQTGSYGSNHYIGANNALGTVAWGVFNSGSTFPASLYLTSSPSFFPGGTPWPMFGPDVSNWGDGNLVPARTSQALRANRVQNWQMEDVSLKPWFYGAVFAQSTADKHSGATSVKLTGTGAWSNLGQDVPVTANTEYVWSVWAKSSSTGLRLKMLTTSNATLRDCGSAVGDNTWRQYIYPFNPGAQTMARIYLGDGGGTHYIDDVIVKANIVSNGGFETGSAGAWALNSGWTVSNVDKKTGTYSLRLVGTGGFSSAQQTTTVASQTYHTLSFWAKSSTTGGRIKILTPGQALIADFGSTVGDNTWRQYTFVFNSGANTQVNIYFGDGGGNHYIDDVVLF